MDPYIPFTFKLFKHGSRKVPLPTLYENLGGGENKHIVYNELFESYSL